MLIDGLPLTAEGYSRVKSVLSTKFGKPSEVAAAHVLCITSFPVVTNANSGSGHEFFEKLTISVQTLDNMGKLRD